MKRIFSSPTYQVIIIGFLFTLANSCNTEVDPKLLPALTTTEISKVTEATAQSGGNITSDAGSDVTSRGVCWSTSPNPTIEDNKTTDAAGTGVFISKLTGLIQRTTYYVRAYATNKKGTAYGIQITFSTKSLGLSTKPISSITINYAEGGGIIGTDGDSLNVSARGICWNTQPTPTILNSKTTNGKGVGDFTSSLTALSLDTKYYVRAYATNSSGTIYGNEVTFTTQNGIIILNTNSPTSITPTTVTIQGNITSDGGSSINERGFCISKLPNPSITNKIQNGSGVGSYISTITELTQNTTYYIKAYATNSVGTVYGNEVSFTTTGGIISLTTNPATDITVNSATLGGTILSDGGLEVTSRGICYGTSPNPTIELNNKIVNGFGVGPFTNSITGLNIETTYYFRSFGTNSYGTFYGAQQSFTTLRLGIGYSETFSTSLGLFTTQSVIGSQLWNVASGYATMSGYALSLNNANEDWLISPQINLTGTTAPKLSFDHVSRYFTNPVTEAAIMISTNYVSGLPSTATWSQLSPPTPFVNLANWSFVNSGAIDLTLYSNYKVNIAFKYTSTTTKAGTWEVKNFLIYE